MQLRNKILGIAGAVLLFAGLFGIEQGEVILGDTYTNAYDYYVEHGNDIVFVPEGETDGRIYYGTCAKTGSSAITYGAIGWKVTIRDLYGNSLQEIYLKVGGSYLETVEDVIIGNYSYTLYSMKLSTLRSRMNTNVQSALEKGNCTITFDGCMIVRKNGVDQGAVTDNGISWGTVYTTYNGISSAQWWSAETMRSLKSYFDKEIDGLFVRIDVGYGDGIIRVYGQGTYCYGTMVTVGAEVRDGYHFSKWSGGMESSENPLVFRAVSDLSLTAVGEKNAGTNRPPVITCKDVYISLEEAMTGAVTEERLKELVSAYDTEDGQIPYGKNQRNAFYFVDYQATDFTSFKKAGTVSELLYAVDSHGNQTWKSLTVHIVDSSIYDASVVLGQPRFICRKYIFDEEGNWIPEEEGGLKSGSVWRHVGAYRSWLLHQYR